MNRTILRGLDGTSPLGFFAALGLLRVLQPRGEAVRLGFLTDGTFRPYLEGLDADLAAVVAEDAIRSAGRQPWSLEYAKTEKSGVKTVADLKAPPDVFREFVARAIAEWASGKSDGAAYAAAFGTTSRMAVDGKGNTKPTAFHFTAANQKFLETVESIRASITRDWAEQSLFVGHAARSGSNLRWDPAAERNWALMAENPNEAGTTVDAPTEWLAFRGMPFFPTFPLGSRIVTTAVDGRGGDMKLTWPLWSVPLSIAAIRSVLPLDWTRVRQRAARGVFAVCTSMIRRTSQGFGNFGPASVTS